MESLRETLERLETAEGFFVSQNWDALEQISYCYEQRNTYDVSSIPKDRADRKKGHEGAYKYFQAVEESGVCARLCCGENRGFTFKFEDFESKKTVIELQRRYRCCGWAVLPCCAHRVDVHAMLQGDSQGGFEVIGSPNEKTLAAQVQSPMWHGGCCCPTFYLNDQDKNYFGELKGSSCWWLPCCICDVCGMEFMVYNKEGKVVGKLQKLGIASCKDFLMETKTDADKYLIEFDDASDLGLNFKLAVLAAAIQVDFNFFEDKRGIYECHCCDLFCCGYALPCLPLCCLIACCISTEDKKRKGSVLDGHKGGVPQQALEL